MHPGVDRVVLDACDHVKTRLLKAQGKAADAGEQIDSDRPAHRTAPRPFAAAAHRREDTR